jgi:hypothetical protein
VSDQLELVIAHGNRGHHYLLSRASSQIECADGFSASVIAGGGTYCKPRPALCICGLFPDDRDPIISAWKGYAPHDFHGPYTHVELGFPSECPEPWDEWKEYAENPEDCGTVYSFVPVEMVRALFALHGGEIETIETEEKVDGR